MRLIFFIGFLRLGRRGFDAARADGRLGSCEGVQMRLRAIRTRAQPARFRVFLT